MSPQAQCHLTRETLVSAAVNGVLSIAFFVVVFGSADPLPVWGTGNYAFDFVPQSVAIGFMASLVPALLTRNALAAKRLTGAGAPPTSGSIVRRALIMAPLAAVTGVGLCVLVLWAAGANGLANTTALVAKVAYGAVLGAVVTRIVLRSMLA